MEGRLQFRGREETLRAPVGPTNGRGEAGNEVRQVVVCDRRCAPFLGLRVSSDQNTLRTENPVRRNPFTFGLTEV